MVPFEVSIAILNHNNCGHWPPFEKPAEWAAPGPRVPQGLLTGRFAGFGRGASPPLASQEIKRYFYGSNVAFADGGHSGGNSGRRNR
jgi:hypothetical protein